jgi:hypothetical protein
VARGEVKTMAGIVGERSQRMGRYCLD